MTAVSKWSCAGCNHPAVKMETKVGQRWFIVHHTRCPIQPNLTEDVGPVTSVNDPDNVHLVKDD